MQLLSGPYAIAACAVLIILWLWRALGSRASSADVSVAFRPSARQLRPYTRAQVAEHASPGDAWIIVRDKVYDVTPYVEEHPGGRAILKHAGGDATKGFHGPQHPPRVFDLIDDFQIGEVVA